MLKGWIIKYNRDGLDALKNKKKPGNTLSKFSNLINNDWNTTRPLEKITSNTTMIWFKKPRDDFPLRSRHNIFLSGI